MNEGTGAVSLTVKVLLGELGRRVVVEFDTWDGTENGKI